MATKYGFGAPRLTSRSRSLATWTTPRISGKAPCANSAPSSTGPSAVWCVMTRPPRRSRASSTRTRAPAAESSRAAVRPATPAPMITTCGSVINRLDSSSMTDLDQLERLQSCGGSTFRELYEIYAASIALREQKPEAWICAAVRAPEYWVGVMKDAGHVNGFSILFLPPAERFALLEYMAVTPERRNRGLGSAVFKQTVVRAMSLPILLEVDSDREASPDREMRTRRQQFYRRLGCVRVSGLHYILPLPGQGPVQATAGCSA